MVAFGMVKLRYQLSQSINQVCFTILGIRGLRLILSSKFILELHDIMQQRFIFNKAQPIDTVKESPATNSLSLNAIACGPKIGLFEFLVVGSFELFPF